MAQMIVLNKRTKTIKIVNRKDRISLKRPINNITLRQSGKRGPAGSVVVGSTTTVAPETPASVTNTGTATEAVLNFEIPQGDKGDKGDTGISTFVRVHHGTDPDVARPDAVYVEWVGSAEPNNATILDTWVKIVV